jgi:small subunit ribosomal protein S6
MARNYELVLMLDPEADEDARNRVADDARKRIESDGELAHAESWGMRSLAYEIRQRNEADYRFYRFSAGNELLEALNHSLRITDGVLRFRIFQVDTETPTTAPPAAAQPAAAGADRRGERE